MAPRARRQLPRRCIHLTGGGIRRCGAYGRAIRRGWTPPHPPMLGWQEIAIPWVPPQGAAAAA
eukprot:39020-Alexandrium_andersonii.AAC.1